MKWFIRLIMMTPQKAAQKPLIVSWVRNLSARNISPTLMTTLKSPRVRKTTGRAIISIIGLIKALINPITVPATNKSKDEPLKMKPGMSLVAIRMAMQLARIRNKILIMSNRFSYIKLIVV